MKNHFISGFSTNDRDVPIFKWDLLLYQYVITLNLICNSRVKPDLSVYAYLLGPFDFNKSPMASPITRVIVHDKPGNRIAWGIMAHQVGIVVHHLITPYA